MQDVSVVAISDAAAGGTEENIMVLSPTVLTGSYSGERNSMKLGACKNCKRYKSFRDETQPTPTLIIK